MHRRRRVDEVADAVDVDDERLADPAGGAPAKPRDHDATARCSGGASAWQIATASASAAWFGAGNVVEAEDRLHHLPHLLLLRAAVAADGLLDRSRRVLSARDAGGRRGDEHGSARLPDGECDAGVGADVRLLQGDGIRLVLRDQLLDAREDREQPRLQPLPRRRSPPPVARGPEAPVSFVDDPVPASSRPWVDSEDFHEDTLGIAPGRSSGENRSPSGRVGPAMKTKLGVLLVLSIAGLAAAVSVARPAVDRRHAAGDRRAWLLDQPHPERRRR